MMIIDLIKNLSTYYLCVEWQKKFQKSQKTVLSIFVVSFLSYVKGTKSEILVLFKLLQLIFAIDDVFDDKLFDPTPLDTELFSKAARKNENALRSQFLAFFDDIEASLYQLVDDSDGRKQWRESVSEMINAMNDENKEENLLSLENYLEVSKKSFGLYMYNLGLALIMKIDLKEDPFLLNTIFNSSARFLRLSNDIRSYERELEEGKINSIGILINQGETLESAKKKVREIADAEYNSIARLYLVNPHLSPFIMNVLRYIDFTDKLYNCTDFRTSKFSQFFKLLFTPVEKFGEPR
jgi:hypothetical protein